MVTDSLFTYYVGLSFLLLLIVVFFPRFVTKIMHGVYHSTVVYMHDAKDNWRNKLLRNYIEFNKECNQNNEEHVNIVGKLYSMTIINIITTLCAYLLVDAIAPLIYIIIGISILIFLILICIYRLKLIYSMFDYKSNYLVLKILLCAFIIFVLTWNVIIYDVPNHGVFYYGIYGLISFLIYPLLFRVYADALKETRESGNVVKKNMSKVVFIIIALFIFSLSLMIYMFCRDNTLFLVNGNSEYLSYFNCLYFVVITFFTIGYGDIVPVGMLAKFFSILISFTSLACITVLVGASLSIKNETK